MNERVTTYYSLRTLNPHRCIIAKFTDDASGFNVAATYDIDREDEGSPWRCSCPAFGHHSCKHIKRLMPILLPKADSDEFYCDDTSSWSQPLSETFYDRGGVDVVIADAQATINDEEELVEIQEEEEAPEPKPAENNEPKSEAPLRRI